MPRLVVLSDIHLSPTHGFFWENWRIARQFANDSGADAVVVNGDLAIDGPDSDDEITFAARAIKTLKGDVLVLPGNHDVGDEPPGQDAEQIIDATRIARWNRSFGTDCWSRDLDGWRLIGINAQLLGSGLPAEAVQNRFLDAALDGALPIALFTHKPLFLDDPQETVASIACTPPAPRADVLARLRRAGVRIVVSGHLHQHRDRVLDGVRHLWLPAVAFAAPHDLGGAKDCGVVVLDLAQDRIEIAVERPAGLISHDLAAIKGHGRYAFLRDMPPCPPPAEL
jgi:3',5'-cyclic AMP phosphodiesterase CpdA